jgi:putative ABC transport system permease protein
MGSRMEAWRPALRIARRDVLRSKGRSAVVAVMVGVPVALVTCLASLYATNDVSDVESIPSRLGTTAAELEVVSDRPVWQDPQMAQIQSVAPQADGNMALTPPQDADSSATVQRLHQATGGRIIDVPSAPTLIRTDRGRLTATVVSADVTSPELQGLVNVQRGRLPRTDDEVVVSHRLADRGFTIGSTIGLHDGASPATVVGVGEVPYPGMSQTVLALPGLKLSSSGDVSHRYLLERSTSVTWDEVRRLNASGVAVFSRAVVEHPPTGWEASLPANAQPWNTSTNAAEKAVLVLVVFSIVLEIVLLAGPAFAVGVRRQGRQLALVAATGGSARDVRRVVLAQGIALGAGASLAGAAFGVGVARGLVWALPRYRGTSLGPWDVDWLSTGLAILLGAVAAVIAAWAPARAASRADVVAVLAGRRVLDHRPREDGNT